MIYQKLSIFKNKNYYLCNIMNNNIKIEHHPWEPFIPNNAKVLFLGSFPPKENKWCMDFYYPNKINDFWRIIGLIFYNNIHHFWNKNISTFNKELIISFLNSHNIAVADAAKEVKRLKDNASDKFLEIITPINLIDLLCFNPNCNTIVTTGQKAAEVIANITNTSIPPIGNYEETTIENRNIRIYRMPSTSRAYPLSISQKSSFYKKLFSDLEILNQND